MAKVAEELKTVTYAICLQINRCATNIKSGTQKTTKDLTQFVHTDLPTNWNSPHHFFLEEWAVLHTSILSNPGSKAEEVAMILNAQLAGNGDTFLFQMVSCEVIASDDTELNHHLFLWELQKWCTLTCIYIYIYMVLDQKI